MILFQSLNIAEKRFILSNNAPVKLDRRSRELLTLLSDKNGQPSVKKKEDKGLGVRRSRLINKVLESLRFYHRKRSPRIRMMNLLIDIELLYDHGEFKLCRKFINKAKKLANEFELWNLLLIAIQWEQLLYREEGKFLDQSRAELSSIHTHSKEVLNRIAQSTELQYHLLDFLILSRNKIGPELKEELEQYEEILSDATWNKGNAPMTDQIYRANLQGMFHFGKGTFDESLQHFTQAYASLCKFDPQMQLFQREHFIALNNLVAVSSTLQKYDDAMSYMDILEKQFASLPKFERSWFNTTELYKLAIFYELGEYDRGMKSIPTLERRLNNYLTEINPVNYDYYAYNIALFYHLFDKPSNAMEWITNLVNANSSRRKKVRSQIFYYGLLFRLLLLYDMGRLDTIKYLLDDTVKYMRQSRKLSGADLALIQFFKKTVKSGVSSAHIAELHDSLIKLQSEAFTLLQFLNITAWCASKLSKRSLKDVLIEQRLQLTEK